ncbi:hypothetical protein E4U57_007602 [Claviceps arundinis]|uniref:Major facilitator superfamily transporter n=1 Tax=Claviceps arundinis TaxID=1623583 RepID=A0ABQ7PMJ4_9HYPO|nr:hypothetical protein E4U57_007602 [Claviceps arundinis]
MDTSPSTRRPGDMIPRPSPAHSPPASDFTFFPYIHTRTGDPVKLKNSITGPLSGLSSSVRYASGKHADVELVPQPSDDAQDPLNWPCWQRDLHFVSLLVMVVIVGATKTVFIPTAGSLSELYRVSGTSIAVLTAVPLMVSALTGIISAIVARFWGKRPVYMAAALLMFVGTMWNMTAGDHYGSCLAARVIQGLGWGAFDVLVNGSIQDTYFEHERNVPLTIYNIASITATWGAPLLVGLASNVNGFTAAFRIINCLYGVALPLLAFAAPESAFDRANGAATSIPPPKSWRFRYREKALSVPEYFAQMKLFSSQAPVTFSSLLQAPRALVAPTTWMLFLLTLVPFGALWGLTTTISIITTPAPLSLRVSLTGVLMTGPWAISILCVGGISLYRGLHGQRSTRHVSCLLLAAGTALVLIGLLSYGLGIHSFMNSHPSSSGPIFSPVAAKQVSLPLLSLQLGILAGGSYTLDTTVRAFIARSASFTSSSVAVSQRTSFDMLSAVTVLRSIAMGNFVLILPHVVTNYGGLKAAVIGLAAIQAVLTAGPMTLWWLCDKSVWQVDGKIMDLVNWRLLRRASTSFFDAD